MDCGLWTASRKILHIDMDAFFAAVEVRDRPELAGKPVIVGGDPQSRGVVSTASYEARKFGVHSAMPAARAKRLCPQGIFLKPDFSKYKKVSEQIYSILSKYTSVIESGGLDEAYLDVTENNLKIEDPILLAQMIQQNIKAATKLTGSVGVAPNKYLAKIASDYQKPAGLTVIWADEVELFLENLLVRKIPGIGPVTEKELHALGIKTVGELALRSKEDLIRHFGKWGVSLYERARGIDTSPVEPWGEPKQIGSEETFERDLMNLREMEGKIKSLAEEVSFYLKRRAARARTVTLKVKYSDFTVITRSRTLHEPFDDADTIITEARRLLAEKTEAGKRLIRLLGVSASNLESAEEENETKATELDLFH